MLQWPKGKLLLAKDLRLEDQALEDSFLRFIAHGMRPTTIPCCSVVIISCVILCKLMSHRTPRCFMRPSRCKDSVCGRQVPNDVIQYILLWVALAIVETSQLFLDRHLEAKYQAECRYDCSLLPRGPHASPWRYQSVRWSRARCAVTSDPWQWKRS